MQLIHYGKYKVREVNGEKLFHFPPEAVTGTEYYLSYNKDNGVIKAVPVIK
jgi:hypothetical protein